MQIRFRLYLAFVCGSIAKIRRRIVWQPSALGGAKSNELDGCKKLANRAFDDFFTNEAKFFYSLVEEKMSLILPPKCRGESYVLAYPETSKSVVKTSLLVFEPHHIGGFIFWWCIYNQNLQSAILYHFSQSDDLQV